MKASKLMQEWTDDELVTRLYMLFQTTGLTKTDSMMVANTTISMLNGFKLNRSRFLPWFKKIDLQVQKAYVSVLPQGEINEGTTWEEIGLGSNGARKILGVSYNNNTLAPNIVGWYLKDNVDGIRPGAKYKIKSVNEKFIELDGHKDVSVDYVNANYYTLISPKGKEFKL